MSKVTITFEDVDDGTVTFQTSTDAVVPDDTKFQDLSPALQAAYLSIRLINIEVLGDKNVDESGEEPEAA